MSIAEALYTCVQCGETKGVEGFYWSKGDGKRRSDCKVCTLAEAASPEGRARARLSELRYMAEHRDEINARRRARRITDGEKQRQHEKAYAIRHKERILERNRLREPDQQPARPVVYRFYGNDGALLYVGTTIQWKKRLYKHRRYTPWFAEVCHLEVDYYLDEDTAADAEVALIRSQRPRYNLTLARKPNRGRKPRAPRGGARDAAHD